MTATHTGPKELTSQPPSLAEITAQERPGSQIQVAVIDDEDLWRERVSTALSDLGPNVVGYSSPERFSAYLEDNPGNDIDVAFVDVTFQGQRNRLPELVNLLQAKRPLTSVIALSANIGFLGEDLRRVLVECVDKFSFHNDPEVLVRAYVDALAHRRRSISRQPSRVVPHGVVEHEVVIFSMTAYVRHIDDAHVEACVYDPDNVEIPEELVLIPRVLFDGSELLQPNAHFKYMVRSVGAPGGRKRIESSVAPVYFHRDQLKKSQEIRERLANLASLPRRTPEPPPAGGGV